MKKIIIFLIIGFILGVVVDLGRYIYREWRAEIRVEAMIQRENYLLDRYQLIAK